MIRKMLVALDGSRTSESTLPAAALLLRGIDAEITFVTVIPEDSGSQRIVAKGYLDPIATGFGERGAATSVEILIGRPAKSLVDCAVRGGFDLIVLGTHGASGLLRLVRGSVTEDVLRRSPVPVLVVHPERTAERMRTILLPLDGSHRAEAILPWAADLAKAFGAAMVLVHVIPDRLKGMMLPSEVIASTLERAQTRLRDLGIEGAIEIRSGDAATEILRLAEEVDADVIAMSTHGRSGLDRLKYGSVAETVLRRSPRSLLVVRTAAVPREHRGGAKMGRRAMAAMRELARNPSPSPFTPR